MSITQAFAAPGAEPSSATLRTRALTPAIGAEITGVDLSQPMSDEVFAGVLDAWHQSIVVLFRDQHLTEDDQVRFGERFGPPAIVHTPQFKTNNPAVMLISNVRENGRLIGALPDGEMNFHTDQCHQERPAMASMLYALEVPPAGGNTLFANGYLAVLQSKFSSGAYKDVANPAGTWDPPTALTEFQAAYTAHPSINAVLMPNDENGAPIIHYLITKGIKPMTFPVTGQDATLTGLQNVISGYQCGTVYKPIYLEAQAAAALAMYLRAGVTPPAGLVNGMAMDVNTHVDVPSILETPEWVVPSTVQSTVIKDGFVPASQLCSGSYAADCTKYGITG